MWLPEWCRNEDKDDRLWEILDKHWGGPYGGFFREGVIAGFMCWKVDHFVVQDDDDDTDEDIDAAAMMASGAMVFATTRPTA